MAKKMLFLCCAILFFSSLYAQQLSPKPGFDEALRQITERYKAVGLAIVVVKNNNKTTTQKVAMLLGQTTRSVATGVFFIWIYPVLKFVS